jgi:ABC-type Na+ efflux pump permease subunit
VKVVEREVNPPLAEATRLAGEAQQLLQIINERADEVERLEAKRVVLGNDLAAQLNDFHRQKQSDADLITSRADAYAKRVRDEAEALRAAVEEIEQDALTKQAHAEGLLASAQKKYDEADDLLAVAEEDEELAAQALAQSVLRAEELDEREAALTKSQLELTELADKLHENQISFDEEIRAFDRRKADLERQRQAVNAFRRS